MVRQQVGNGDGSTLYLDETGGLVIVPRKPLGPRMTLELVLSRQDAINLAVAIMCWKQEEATDERA